MAKNSILIIKKLREEIFSEKIISDYKVNQKDFTRKRKHPIAQIYLSNDSADLQSVPAKIGLFVL
ncbi:hypothetical protein IW18_00570 [Flavobacterium hibernum]|uniref:Uncharacterized protein n=1 Tax=Flavobacterium hibernum TaxID=37752 RepID=A0A0D0ENF8_9FLAO|nr:hypothetical protein IW18_00570 [Flavobacterium hibernum]OXA84608.1 hypothetical protein B0A73_18470 [Flavobacterium hibernum]